MFSSIILPLIVALGSNSGPQHLDVNKRLETVIRQIERSKDKAETLQALIRYKRVIADRDKAWREEYSYIEQFRADNSLFLAKWNELKKRYPDNHAELGWIDEKIWVDLLQKMHRLTKTERVSQLKAMAREARKDFSITDEDVYFGPWCGTYDHTFEHKVEWSARRYLDESVQALKQGSWDGRTYLMRSIQGHSDWKSHPEMLTVLKLLATDQNTLVRGEAMLMLGHYSIRESESYVLAGLKHRSADTRAKALRAATQLKLLSAEPSVIKLTRDKVSEVSSEAFKYIVGVDSQEGKECLLTLLTERENIYDVLGAIRQLKFRDAIPLIRELLSDEDEYIRRAAKGALEELDKLVMNSV